MPKLWITRSCAVALVVALLVSLAGCGGDSSSDDDAAAPEQGEPDRMVIWAPSDFQKPLDATIAKFKLNQPDITVDVEYGSGPELRDRLLVGERPDLYLNTALQLQNLADDRTVPKEFVDFGSNQMELVVAPGNPKGVVDLTVFGVDPLTTSGLCEREVACGRTAEKMLSDALVTPEPDVIARPSELVDMIINGTMDVALLFRTQAVAAHREGKVQYVPLPSNVTVQIPYQFAVVRKGDATDLFIDYIENSNTLVNVLGQAGYAPLEEDAP